MAISKPARSAGCDLAAERPRHWPRSGLVTLAAEHSANLITKHAAVRLKKPKIFFGRAPRARSAQPLRGSGAPRKAAPRPILALRLTRSASRVAKTFQKEKYKGKQPAAPAAASSDADADAELDDDDL